MSQQAAVTKYRPVLTASQINQLLTLVEAAAPTVEHLLLRGILAPFAFKIQCGAISAAYSLRPVVSLEQSLGMEALDTPVNPAEKRLEAFNKWKRVGARFCSNEELELVNTYRWEMGMMSVAEALAFESVLFPTTT